MGGAVGRPAGGPQRPTPRGAGGGPLSVVLASTGMVKLPPNLGGGIERYVCDLAQMLRESGVRTAVVSDVREGADFPGIETVPVRSPFDAFPLPAGLSTLSHMVGGLQVARSLRRHLDRAGAGNPRPVLHLNEEVSALVACRLFPDVPKVYTLHNPPVGPTDRRRPIAETGLRAAGSWVNRRLVLDEVDRVVALNPALARYLVSDWGIEPGRVACIPVPVDTRLYAPGPPWAGRPRVLFVGRLDGRKGIGSFLDAAERAREPATFVVVGNGPLLGSVRRRLADRRLADRVELHPGLPTRGVVDELRRAQLFVLPSRLEVYPRVVVEAAACGVPTVLPDLPMYEVFRAGGFTLSYDRPEELPGLIDGLLRDPERRLRLARRAHAYALAHNSFDTVAARLVRLYEEAGA